MPIDNEPIRIGRIARATERALGLSLTGEVSIYMEAGELDRLARKRPKDYLSFLEAIGMILHCPDFVSFQEESEEFIYMKNYFKGSLFTPAFVVVGKKGKPGRFYFKKIGFGPKTALPTFVGDVAFVRPVYRRGVPGN